MDIVKVVWLPLLISAAVAYLLGSLNFGIIVTKLLVGEDIREKGSGNAGATNVLRSHGKGLAALTTLGDLGKCIAAVLLAKLCFFPLLDAGTYAGYGAYIAGLFCIIGHLYPLYFGFRGGKGVMTTLGMMLVLDWQIALVCLALFIILVAIWRMVSLGSICASTYIPVLTFIFRCYVDELSFGTVIFCTVLSALNAAIIIFKHGSNMRRLADGTERRIGQDKE